MQQARDSTLTLLLALQELYFYFPKYSIVSAAYMK